MAKTVYIILAFHGHEPLWELPGRLLDEAVTDEEMRQSVPAENWIKQRAEQGRDVYLDLVRFAEDLDLPVTLEATNELLTQVAEFAPQTHQRLSEAYRAGRLYPLYGHAHHGHAALLTDEEISDEIRLNQEYLHDVMGAPHPKYRGVFPTEDSIDASKLGGLVQAGIDYVVFPNLSQRKAHYVADRPFNEQHDPFLIGPDIIALPRHFPVSQYIWRPVTKMRPDQVKSQGYLLGRFWVFDEEYRRQRFVDYPIDDRQGIDEYKRILRRALVQSPDHGLILYIQDLELMDFGDVALDVMLGAWRELMQDRRYDLRFVTPDEYIDREVKPRLGSLPRLKFHQFSWAPEIRLVLRYDGHYPPLDAGPFRERDLVPEVFKRWPFIFWEPGRYIKDVTNGLMDMFGYGFTLPVRDVELAQNGFSPASLDTAGRVALCSRVMKRACNWGWFPNEGLQKRPFLDAYVIADTMLRELDKPEVADAVASRIAPLDDGAFRGLAQVLEIVVDTRHDYLMEGIARIVNRNHQPLDQAVSELERARVFRDEALKSIAYARECARGLSGPEGRGSVDVLRCVLAGFRDYCRGVFLAIDHLQRTWMNIPDIPSTLLAMYDYLYQLYPPKFPAILESTLSEDELAAVERPALR